MESSLWATTGKGIIIQALNHLGLKMQPILFGRISMQHCPNYMIGKIWEDPVGSRCHQFSPIWRTSLTRSLRSFARRRFALLHTEFSLRANLFHTTFLLLEMIPSGGMSQSHTFSEHVNFLMSTMSTSENSIYCVSYPVLSYHFRHHPSTIHSASHRRTVTNLLSVKKYPTWSFKHDKFRKKNYQPLSLVHLKGECSSQTWELNEPNCKQSLLPDHIKIPRLFNGLIFE